MLEPIEPHVRGDERLDPNADLVVRGWPLTVEGMLSNAEATRSRYSWGGQPFIAVSTEVTVPGWTLDTILRGPRLRTRSRYALARALTVLDAGFELVPTFGAPHYSVRLPSYDVASAERLLDVLGEIQRNPHYIGNRP